MNRPPIVDYASPAATTRKPFRWRRKLAVVASLGLCLWYGFGFLNASQQAADWKRCGAEARTGVSLQDWVIEARAEALAALAVVGTGWGTYFLLAWRRSAAG